MGVIIMIQGHVMDAWTLGSDRARDGYHWISFVGGLAGTPIFLFLAGVALALAAGARTRGGRPETDVAALARRRGWEIFGLAFLFRLQSWIISGGPPRTLLKVDILNVMGLSMVAAAVLWGAGRARPSRAMLLAGAAVASAMLTPLVRASSALSLLPDPIEAYLRPAASATTFTLFPWAGFVFAGAAVGLWLDAARTVPEERRVNMTFAVIGAGLALGGYAASWLPPLYAETQFWTSSPTFFFVRLGIVLALVPMAFLWNGVAGRSWLCEFGRASLFVYWIHVEMAYGVISMSLHRRLPLEQAYLGFVLLTALLFGLVRLKNRIQTTKFSKDTIEKVFRGLRALRGSQNAIRYVNFAITARLRRSPVRSSRRSL